MCKVNPEQRKNVRMENGVNVLYLRLLKSFYGCMESALSSYDLDAKTLKSQGFVVNIYDTCIANSTIDCKHRTIAWYVDDNNVLQFYKHVNTGIIEAISEFFGELTILKGENKNFMVMDIEFLVNGIALILMKDCIEESIASFVEALDEKLSLPAKKDLQNINENSTRLDKQEADTLHYTVAKILQEKKRGRNVIEKDISFLYTRVTKITVEVK